jgi:hypothetical protein
MYILKIVEKDGTVRNYKCMGFKSDNDMIKIIEKDEQWSYIPFKDIKHIEAEYRPQLTDLLG